MIRLIFFVSCLISITCLVTCAKYNSSVSVRILSPDHSVTYSNVTIIENVLSAEAEDRHFRRIEDSLNIVIQSIVNDYSAFQMSSEQYNKRLTRIEKELKYVRRARREVNSRRLEWLKLVKADSLQMSQSRAVHTVESPEIHKGFLEKDSNQDINFIRKQTIVDSTIRARIGRYHVDSASQRKIVEHIREHCGDDYLFNLDPKAIRYYCPDEYPDECLKLLGFYRLISDGALYNGVDYNSTLTLFKHAYKYYNRKDDFGFMDSLQNVLFTDSNYIEIPNIIEVSNGNKTMTPLAQGFNGIVKGKGAWFQLENGGWNSLNLDGNFFDFATKKFYQKIISPRPAMKVLFSDSALFYVWPSLDSEFAWDIYGFTFTNYSLFHKVLRHPYLSYNRVIVPGDKNHLYIYLKNAHIEPESDFVYHYLDTILKIQLNPFSDSNSAKLLLVNEILSSIRNYDLRQAKTQIVLNDLCPFHNAEDYVLSVFNPVNKSMQFYLKSSGFIKRIPVDSVQIDNYEVQISSNDSLLFIRSGSNKLFIINLTTNAQSKLQIPATDRMSISPNSSYLVLSHDNSLRSYLLRTTYPTSIRPFTVKNRGFNPKDPPMDKDGIYYYEDNQQIHLPNRLLFIPYEQHHSFDELAKRNFYNPLKKYERTTFCIDL